MTASQRRAAVRRRNQQMPILVCIVIALGCLMVCWAVRGGW